MMASPGKASASSSGKRGRSKSGGEDDNSSKRVKSELSNIMGDISILNRARIYNYGVRKKPAELFRKDLISAMKLPDSDQLNREDYLLISDPWKEEWEKGVQVPVNPDALRESQVCDIQPPEAPQAATSSAESPFKMPKKLLRYDPERDPAASKYEIDLTDSCWLDNIKDSEEAFPVSENMFEDIMDELEHHCARNMKAKHVGIEYDDHIVCDICRSPDAEDGNEMVFCDACNICVHQACYGITEIPDGEWLCRPCKELRSHKKSVSCMLCPNLGGAFKPTSNGKWAHVSCALWVPEVSIGCVTTMEPITKIKQIPSSRWNLTCALCDIKQGTPIQCSIKTCKTAYHVTCAFNSNLKMRAIVENSSKGVKLKSYCSRHSEKDDTDKNNTELGTNQRAIEIATSKQSESDKNNRFWMYIDMNELNQSYVPKLQKAYSELPPQQVQFHLDMVLQYWKLKRTSNYGLPLIKVVSSDTMEELQMQRRQDILRLRVNLERIRNLSYMICRREKVKRTWMLSHQEVVMKSLTILTGVKLPTAEGEEPSSPQKKVHVTEDNIRLAKDLINASIIYDDKVDEADNNFKTKKIIRELNRQIKVEKIKKVKPNPYAKFYDSGAKRKSECEEASPFACTLINGIRKLNGVLPLKMPLKSKSVPANVIGNNSSISENSPARDITPLKNRIARAAASDKDPEPVLTRSSGLTGYRIPKKSPKQIVINPKDAESLTKMPVCSVNLERLDVGSPRNKMKDICVDVAIGSVEKCEQETKKSLRRFHLRTLAREQHNCSGLEVALCASAAGDVDLRRERTSLRRSLFQ